MVKMTRYVNRCGYEAKAEFVGEHKNKLINLPVGK